MKRYVLFIVEGQNDKKEIQAMIRAISNTFLEDYVDEYYVRKGDITTEKDTSEKTIIQKLNKIVLDWRNGLSHPYQKIPHSDIKKIIHVIDTDGVFIPEVAVTETDDAKVQYQDRLICYFDRSQIIGRNRKKAKIIRKLLLTKQIDNIPYEVFFASCNMDHLLFNNRNFTQADKGDNAFIFARECKNKEYLSNSVFCSGICAEGDYTESWNMIQLGYNSLDRHTNLNIMLEGLPK